MTGHRPNELPTLFIPRGFLQPGTDKFTSYSNPQLNLACQSPGDPSGCARRNQVEWQRVGKSMTNLEPSSSQNEVDLLGIAQIAWYALVVFLVLGGLLLSARAGDNYMAMSGLLFAGFGFLLGFRLLRRLVP